MAATADVWGSQTIGVATHDPSGHTVATGLMSGDGMSPRASTDLSASSHSLGMSVGTTSMGGYIVFHSAEERRHVTVESVIAVWEMSSTG